jgi:hypothetical protein
MLMKRSVRWSVGCSAYGQGLAIRAKRLTHSTPCDHPDSKRRDLKLKIVSKCRRVIGETFVSDSAYWRDVQRMVISTSTTIEATPMMAMLKGYVGVRRALFDYLTKCLRSSRCCKMTKKRELLLKGKVRGAPGSIRRICIPGRPCDGG